MRQEHGDRPSSGPGYRPTRCEIRFSARRPAPAASVLRRQSRVRVGLQESRRNVSWIQPRASSFIEFPGDHQHPRYPADSNSGRTPCSFSMGTRSMSDSAPMVAAPIAVPKICGRHHPLFQYPSRTVFAALKFVCAPPIGTDIQIFSRDTREIHHAVGFHIQRPAQIIVRSPSWFLEVVGAVPGSAAVELRTVIGQFAHDPGALRRALEKHVL